MYGGGSGYPDATNTQGTARFCQSSEGPLPPRGAQILAVKI